jgi:hypothetical protein
MNVHRLSATFGFLILGVFLSIVPQFAQATVSAATSFPQNLQLRDTGSEVRLLQRFLNAQGFFIASSGPGSPGNETDYFGILTYQALVKFQKANKLPTTGFFGPLTRAVMLAGATVDTPTAYSGVSPAAPKPSASSNTLPAASSSQTTVPLPFPLVSLSYGGGGEGGGGSTNSNNSNSQPVDTPPVISAIATSTSGYSTSTISWTTDKPATSEVVYGMTTSYGSVSTNAALATTHSIILSGLYSGVTYHFAVVSTDGADNTATSSDQTLTTTSAAPIVVYLTSTTTTSWTVPSNWSSYNNLQTIGAGGSGGAASHYDGGSGGGGGGWAEILGLSLTPNASVSYRVGIGGAAAVVGTNATANGNAGGSTWFCSSTSNCGALASSSVAVGAEGGGAGGGGYPALDTGGLAGLGSYPGVGTFTSNGGAGGGDTNADDPFSTGGGGAGGPNGNGADGVSNPGSHEASAGGAGDNGSGGSAGTGVVFNNGGNGGNGTEYDSLHGSGGGGGGGYSYDSTMYNTGAGGNGGLYGGGGGGAYTDQNGGAQSGSGGQGLIEIAYYPSYANPAPPPAPTDLLLSNTTQTTVNVSWSSGGGTTQYYYVAAGVGSTPTCSSGTLVNGTSFELSGLYVGTAYTIVVCAVDAYDVVGPAATANATTLTYTLAGSPPSAASSVGYDVATFYDDFSTSSDIDVNNTGNIAAYRWFTDNGGACNGSSSVLPPGDILTSATSGLTLLNDVSGCGWGIGTYQAWGGNINEVDWAGTGFANGLYVQVNMSFDPSHAVSNFDPFPVPTAWMEGYLGVPNCEENNELDLFEAIASSSDLISPTFSVNDWTADVNCVFSSYDLPNNKTTYAILGAADGSSSVDFTQTHSYGTLWLPASQNSGVGKIERFFDGVHIPSLDATYNDTSGEYDLLDSDTFGLILGAGTDNWPLHVQSVTVWQSEAANAKAGPVLHR